MIFCDYVHKHFSLKFCSIPGAFFIIKDLFTYALGKSIGKYIAINHDRWRQLIFRIGIKYKSWVLDSDMMRLIHQFIQKKNIFYLLIINIYFSIISKIETLCPWPHYIKTSLPEDKVLQIILSTTEIIFFYRTSNKSHKTSTFWKKISKNFTAGKEILV